MFFVSTKCQLSESVLTPSAIPDMAAPLTLLPATHCYPLSLTGDTLLGGACSEESWGCLPAEPLDQTVTLVQPTGEQKSKEGQGSGHLNTSLRDPDSFRLREGVGRPRVFMFVPLPEASGSMHAFAHQADISLSPSSTSLSMLKPIPEWECTWRLVLS